MTNCIDQTTLIFTARSANEGFARAAAACYAAQLDPTLDEVADIKTAVSEAVTNAIVHAYPDTIGKVSMRMRLFENNELEIVVKAWASPMWSRPARRCSPLEMRSVPAWGLPSWRALWTACGCAPRWAREPPLPCASALPEGRGWRGEQRPLP